MIDEQSYAWDNFFSITDYSHIDTHSVITEHNLEYEELDSIKKLRQVFDKMIPAIQQMLVENNIFTSVCSVQDNFEGMDKSNIKINLSNSIFDFFIDDGERELLVEQLIFDILFDKYIKESKMLTRNGYAKLIGEQMIGNYVYNMNSVDQLLKRGMERYSERIENSNKKMQFEELGIDVSKYISYYNPLMNQNSAKKKPKFIWDLLYYNFAVPISSMQYKRNLTADNRNYPRERFYNDLREYNNFVNKLLPKEEETPKKYFQKTMDYYLLESYKRIDFMLKLQELIGKEGVSDMTKEYFLIKRFHPKITVLFEKNGERVPESRVKYYRPLFIMENMLTENMLKADLVDESVYASKLFKYQVIRAKTYELFKLKFSFVPSGYEDIKKFIANSYNMCLYHSSNKIWNSIAKAEWKELNKEQQKRMKKIMRDMVVLENAFFWKESL